MWDTDYNLVQFVKVIYHTLTDYYMSNTMSDPYRGMWGVCVASFISCICAFAVPRQTYFDLSRHSCSCYCLIKYNNALYRLTHVHPGRD